MEGITQEYLNSTPLLGYQLDVTHLHNVLQGVVTAQQQQQQQITAVTKKVAGAENAIGDIDRRLQHIEGALGGFGGADELRSLRQHLVDVARAVDNINEQVLPNMQRQQDDTGRLATGNNQQIQQVANAVPSLERLCGDLRRDVDISARNVAQMSDQLRTLDAQAQEERQDNETRERSRGIAQKQADDLAREAAGRCERLERDIQSRVAPAVNAIEELGRRTNDNFREIENSAKAVDVELAKLQSDLANIRAELNSVDNDGRHRLGKVTEDVDSKFNVVLNLMQNFERNNSLLHDQLNDAGRLLAQRDPRSTAGTRSESASMERPLASGAYPAAAQSNVRRNFSSELERGYRDI